MPQYAAKDSQCILSELCTEAFSGLRHKRERNSTKSPLFFLFFLAENAALSQSMRFGLLKIKRSEGAAPVCNKSDPTTLSGEVLSLQGEGVQVQLG